MQTLPSGKRKWCCFSSQVCVVNRKNQVGPDVGLKKSWFPMRLMIPCVAMGICTSAAKLLQNTWTLGLVGHSHGEGLLYYSHPLQTDLVRVWPHLPLGLWDHGRFLKPPSLWQGRVAPILINIRKANSLMLYQAASVGSDLLPAPGEICAIYLVLNLCLNICSFLFQMISDLMTGISSD